MRILVLSRWLPHPPDNGSKIRILNIVRTLAARHQVVLVAFTAEDEATQAAAIQALGAICEQVRLVPYRGYRPTSAAALRGLLTATPRFLIDTFNPAMAAAVTEAARPWPLDRVVATQIDMAPYAGTAGVPAVLEEVELSGYHDALGPGNPWRQRLRALPAWLKLRAYLRRTLPKFAACTVVSEQERRLVRTVAPAYRRVAVIPNGIDLERLRGDFGVPVAKTVIHAGAMSYAANRDAVHSFLADVWPVVQRSVDGTLLRVTGAVSEDHLASLPPATGVEYTGYLNDVRPAIARSWLSVVPLRRGGGTRLKVLELLALGTPVVATPKGAEGLGLADGQEVLIGATPEAFAQTTVALLRSSELRGRLAHAGRQRVETTYNWEIIGRDFLNLVENLPDRTAAAVSETAGGVGNAIPATRGDPA